MDQMLLRGKRFKKCKVLQKIRQTERSGKSFILVFELFSNILWKTASEPTIDAGMTGTLIAKLLFFFFYSFVHLLAAVALLDELLTLFGLCTLKMNTFSPRPCVHGSDSEKETVVCRPRDKPSHCLSFLFVCLSPVSPLFHNPNSPTSLLYFSSLNIWHAIHLDAYMQTHIVMAMDITRSAVLIFNADKSVPTCTRQWMALCTFTLTWLWKYWLWANHSIKLPVLPTRTADFRSYYFHHDLDSDFGHYYCTFASACHSILPYFNPQWWLWVQTRTSYKTLDQLVA